MSCFSLFTEKRLHDFSSEFAYSNERERKTFEALFMHKFLGARHSVLIQGKMSNNTYLMFNLMVDDVIRIF